MAFIVKKNIHGREYYYLNENKRVDGKVKTKTLAYLGKSKKEAEKKAKKILKEMEIGEKGKKVESKVKMKREEISIEDMATFCRRKGFVYQSGEIYGGFAGFWDFGHLGSELKNNIKNEWWQFHVLEREDVVGIDGSIITHPLTWKASGHVDSFSDVIVKCKKCGKENKIDSAEMGKIKKKEIVCDCGSEYQSQGEFNLMFSTNVGAIAQKGSTAFVRPETAQLIFTNFKSVQENARMKLPFGIAQMGKAFRNEIAPRDFLFRTREFEQMEIEYFIDPKNNSCPYKIPDIVISIYSEDMQKKGKQPEKMKIKDALKKGIIKKDWHAYWLAIEYLWFKNLGANPENFRIRQHLSEELSHYSTDTWDLEYKFPFGWKELEGIADRGDYDLSQHEKFSKKDLKIFDEETKQKISPLVVCEPSLGVERAFLVFMFDSYFYDEGRENIILKLHPKLAPIKAAVFPIVKKEKYEKISEQVFKDLSKEWNVLYDKSGSIGRRYSRNDEVGTPFCITIDEMSLKKKDVTIRERDTKEQIRVKISELRNILRQLIEGEIEFKKAGSIIK